MFILSTTILPRVFPSLEHVFVTVLFPLFNGLDDRFSLAFGEDCLLTALIDAR